MQEKQKQIYNGLVYLSRSRQVLNFFFFLQLTKELRGRKKGEKSVPSYPRSLGEREKQEHDQIFVRGISDQRQRQTRKQ